MEMLGSTGWGWLTLVPAIITIVLSYKTKNVYISLGAGIYVGLLFLNLFNWIVLDTWYLTQSNDITLVLLAFIAPIIQIPVTLANTIGDPWNGGIILQVLFIGAVIQLLTYTGGAKLLASKIAKHSKSVKSTQYLTWFMGLIVFFDDYANSLIVGPIMRPLYDKMKISREKLSFIIDATAAPIAGIAIISTWIGYELGLIQEGLETAGATYEVSAFMIFIDSIPFRFYNILMLIFIVISIKMSRDFGPMLRAERMARKGEKTPGMIEEVEKMEGEDDVKEGIKVSLWDGIVPVALLVVGALIFFYISGYTAIMGTDDTALIELLKQSPFSLATIQSIFSNADASVVLLQSAFLTLIVMFIRGQIAKQFNLSEGISVVFNGMNKLLSTVFILIFAWSIAATIGSLGANVYLVNLLGDSLSPALLPSIGFLLAGVIAFSTGTSFGTMGIILPIIIPLGYSLNPELSFVTIVISSVLTGATFGDHCSPISDTTILSSVGGGCNHIEHVKTQMPYALVVGLISVVAYYFAAIGISPWILLAIGSVIVALVIYFVGEKVEQ